MGLEGFSLGRSIPVPNVQALAASGDLAEIPDRYIRPEMETELAGDVGAEQIPVVDLGRLLSGDSVSRGKEAAKLRSACEDWGFFQLVNHGVMEELIGRMKAAVEEFFGQPLEEKMASSRQPPGSLEGYGQMFVVSEEQKLDWADTLYLLTWPHAVRMLSVWPTHPPNFRETLEEYTLEMKRVALDLLGLLAENLGLTPEKLTGLFTNGTQSIRMNYYPPCRHHADKVLGLSPHSDAGGLTLLLQLSPVPGLQIRRGGRWVAVNPVPGAFVVNIGDTLEVVSNGRYKSVEHRAIVHRENSRLSAATFLRPNDGELIGPLPDLVRDGRPLYQTMTSEEFFKQFFANKLKGKKFLELVKLTE